MPDIPDGAVFDRLIWRLSAKGSEFLRNAEAIAVPERGNVGEATVTHIMSHWNMKHCTGGFV